MTEGLDDVDRLRAKRTFIQFMRPMINRTFRPFYIFLFALAFIFACSDKDDPSIDDSDDSGLVDDADFVPIDWTTSTHSKEADPDFGEVFDDKTVKRIDIVITADR